MKKMVKKLLRRGVIEVSKIKLELTPTSITFKKEDHIVKSKITGLSKFFKQLLKDLLRYIQKKDYDLMILVLGAEGVGKSTLALRIAMYFNYLLHNELFFDLNYIYIDKIDLIKFFENIEEPHRIHLFDEAHNLLSAQETSTMVSRNLINFFKTSRALRQIYILNSINIDLNADVLRRTDLIIVVKDRGWAEVYFHTNKEKLLVELLELKRRYSRSFNVSVVVNMIQTKPNLIIRFKQIEDEEFEKYYKIKFERMLEHKNIIKQSILNKLERDNLISVSELKKEYKLSNSQLAQLLEALEEYLIRDKNKTYVRKDVVDSVMSNFDFNKNTK